MNLETAQFLTQWFDSHVEWKFLGFCLMVYIISRFIGRR